MARVENQYSSIYYSTMIASIGGFIVGFSTVIISGVLLFLDNIFQLSLVQQQVVVSVAILTAMIGVILGGLLNYLFGRKTTLIFAAGFFMVGSVLSFYADHYNLLILSRAIMGLGAGISSMSVPLYISEIVPSNIRGSCVCLMTLLFYLGIFLAYSIDSWVVKPGAWKWILSSPFIFAVILFVGMCYMPKSPFWLMSKNKQDKAIDSLKRLRRVVDVDWEIENIKESSEVAKKIKRMDQFKGVLRATFIGCGIAFFMEITGAHSIFYYIPTLLNKTGLWTRNAAVEASIYIGLICFVAALTTILLIDRHGRRKLLLYGTSTMIVALFCLAILFHFSAYCICHHGLMMLLFLIFAAGYVLGLGSVGWLLIAEIFPMKYRSFLVSLAIAIKWGVNFLISRYFLSQLSYFGGSITFLVYGFISVICILFIYFFVPETGGKSLEAIEEHWLKNSNHGIQID